METVRREFYALGAAKKRGYGRDKINLLENKPISHTLFYLSIGITLWPD